MDARRWLPLAALLVLAGCATDPTAAPAPRPSASAVEVEGRRTVTTAATADTGRVLVDGDGMTLYVSLADTDGRSTCYDRCAQNWPPVLTAGAPMGRGQVDGALLGDVERDDATVQVTYDGRPLYRFSGDRRPGDARGSGLGDAWYAVAPDGALIGADGDAAEPAEW